MRFHRVLMTALLATVVLAPPLVAGKRLSDAAMNRDAAERSLESALRDAREVLDLRAQAQRVETRQRPQEHVLAQVNAALAHAGVPARRLQGLRPDADVALPGTAGGHSAVRLRRQSLTLSFQQMELPELGAFLTAWREQQALWIPSRIELTKARGGAGRGGTGVDDQYDVTLVVSAVYLDESQ